MRKKNTQKNDNLKSGIQFFNLFFLPSNRYKRKKTRIWQHWNGTLKHTHSHTALCGISISNGCKPTHCASMIFLYVQNWPIFHVKSLASVTNTTEPDATIKAHAHTHTHINFQKQNKQELTNSLTLFFYRCHCRFKCLCLSFFPLNLVDYSFSDFQHSKFFW